LRYKIAFVKCYTSAAKNFLFLFCLISLLFLGHIAKRELLNINGTWFLDFFCWFKAEVQWLYVFAGFTAWLPRTWLHRGWQF